MWPLAYIVFVVLQALFPVAFAWLVIEDIPVPNWLETAISSFGFYSSFATYLSLCLVSLTAPALVLLMALITYQRMYHIVCIDLVHGNTALTLIDHQYSLLLEAERRNSFRPAVISVNYSNDFIGHVDYFCHYYSLFYSLGYGPRNLRVPIANGRNCLLEGTALALGGCLNFCLIGALLSIPMMFRVSITWSRQMAIKQSILDYLSGKFDHQLEEKYNG